MIAAVAHERTVTSRVLAMPPLVWIGVRSYGLYLFSWPIYQMMRGIAGKKLTLSEFVVALVITLIVTELSYRFIETPIRKGALGRMRSRLRSTRDPGRRNAVLAGAFAGTALTIFAAGSLATADLEQNEVEQSLEDQAQRLMQIADMTRDEARERLLERVESEGRRERAYERIERAGFRLDPRDLRRGLVPRPRCRLRPRRSR